MCHTRRQSVKNCVRIDGLDENENSETSTAAVVSEFLKDLLKMIVKKDEIVSARRIGVKKTDEMKPRKVIVKFSSVWTKCEICRQSRCLKGKNIYINECLTREAASIHFEARKMVKVKQLWSAYTFDGDVFVKKTRDQRRGTKIKNVHELAYITDESMNGSSDSIRSSQEECCPRHSLVIYSTLWVL